LRTNCFKEKFRRALLEELCDKGLKELEQKSAFRTCLAAQKFFVISNDGDVYACELLPEKLGNLRTEGYDFAQIAGNHKTKKLRFKIKNTGCYCNWPCAVAANTYLNIFSYPHILKRMIHSSRK
jgi:radical SAM protein with 4Fe4S-binding SPASM domain